MKSSVYRYYALATACLGLLLLPVGCYQFSVSIEPDATEAETPVETAVVADTTTPTQSSSTPVFKYFSNSTQASGEGTLRVSNQTSQPVRLALLARQSGESKYKVPAHWDFASKEGIEKGLILSLPNGNLTLDEGDILVAFAQDGSRRYWGPYVVGETNFPVWNSQRQEWEVIFK